jgi:AcrR family transcriptional regulator
MGRARGPTNAQKRQAVLEAAAAMFAERGREVSLAEICRRAGVSRQTIYNHYGDKDGLLTALAARGLAPCPRCPEPAGRPPEEVLAGYGASLLRWAYAPEQATALRGRCRGLDIRSPAGFGAPEPAIRRLAEYISQETAAGRLVAPDPVAAAALFLELVLAGPLLRIVLDAFEPSAPEALEARAWRCAHLFLRGCAEPRHASPAPDPCPLTLGAARSFVPSPAP